MLVDNAAILHRHLEAGEWNDSSAEVDVSLEEWRPSNFLLYVHVAINQNNRSWKESGAIIGTLRDCQ